MTPSFSGLSAPDAFALWLFFDALSREEGLVDTTRRLAHEIADALWKRFEEI